MTRAFAEIHRARMQADPEYAAEYTALLAEARRAFFQEEAADIGPQSAQSKPTTKGAAYDSKTDHAHDAQRLG